MVTDDGSYKERVHLQADGRLKWASSAGYAWVVGTAATESVEAERTWRLVRSHGVHSRTAGERAQLAIDCDTNKLTILEEGYKYGSEPFCQ